LKKHPVQIKFNQSGGSYANLQRKTMPGINYLKKERFLHHKYGIRMTHILHKDAHFENVEI
jgi:hypothetical protein